MDNKGFESSNFIFGFKGVERNYNSFAIVFIFVIILFFLYILSTRDTSISFVVKIHIEYR